MENKITINAANHPLSKDSSPVFFNLKFKSRKTTLKLLTRIKITKEDAEKALQHYIQTGKKLKSRRKGYTLKLKRCGRFKSYYKTKYLGTYSSEQEAEEAINKYISESQSP